MNQELTDLLRTVLSILGIVGGLVTGWVFFRGTAAKDTINLQDSEIKVLKQRLSTVEDQAKMVPELQKEIVYLRGLISANTAISELTKTIAGEFETLRKENNQGHTELAKIFREISQELRSIVNPQAVTVTVGRENKEANVIPTAT